MGTIFPSTNHYDAQITAEDDDGDKILDIYPKQKGALDTSRLQSVLCKSDVFSYLLQYFATQTFGSSKT